MDIHTLSIEKLTAETGNLYESVVIASKRARQISSNLKAELDDKLSYFEGFETELDDARMNEEQARISIEYERKAKPTHLAIDDMLDGEIYYRRTDGEL